jgi:hypothetical protein
MVQSVQKWSDIHDDDCCEHRTHGGTGFGKLTRHNLKICLLNWNFQSELYTPLSVKNLDTAKYVHAVYLDV